MDLLDQYKQQRPEAFQEQKPPPAADPYGRELGTFVRLAMRLSGGHIHDARQANFALLTVAVIFCVIALLLFFGISGSAPTQPNLINP